jgi:hypothetical protein
MVYSSISFKSGSEVGVIDGSTLTAEEFSRKYVAPAIPVIIRNVSFNIEKMLRNFGKKNTPLDQLPVRNYIDHRANRHHADVGEMRPTTARQALETSRTTRDNFYDIQLVGCPSLTSTSEKPVFTKADWALPPPFSSNLMWLEEESPLLYIGAKGTSSNGHMDAGGVGSLFYVVRGRKRIVFFPQYVDDAGKMPEFFPQRLSESTKTQIEKLGGKICSVPEKCWVYIPECSVHHVSNMSLTVAVGYAFVNRDSIERAEVYNSLCEVHWWRRLKASLEE